MNKFANIQVVRTLSAAAVLVYHLGRYEERDRPVGLQQRHRTRAELFGLHAVSERQLVRERLRCGRRVERQELASAEGRRGVRDVGVRERGCERIAPAGSGVPHDLTLSWLGMCHGL